MKNLIFSFTLILIIFNSFGMNAQTNQENNAIEYRIDNYLTKSVANGFSGAVLVAKNGKIILNKGYGFADKEKGIANTSNTVFDIGSVSKQFTAAAILKLVQFNKLKVTDRLSTFFKNLPDDKKDITIHQLLIHSAGITRGIGKTDFDPIPTAEYFEELFATQLLHEPGSKHQYSNAGYSILARVIELASGQDYETFLYENLFKPAGMEQTGYLLPKWNNSVIAKGYSYNVMDIGTMVSRYQKNGQVSWVLKGNGGINSTQEDMYKWYIALKTNRVLSELLTKKLTTPYIIEFEGETSYYAYGWVVFKTPRNTEMIAHDGSNGTFFYDFRWLPEEDVVVIYATNSFTREVGGIAWRVDKMLFDESYIPKEVNVDFVSTLLDYTHHYKGDLNDLSIKIKQHFGEEINSAFYLNRLGGIYLRNNMLTKARIIAELNVELFPDDANIWDSLGFVYYNIGNKQKALEAYEKALSLDPDIPSAQEMIKNLLSDN